jgi:hypothetical protein
MVPGQSEEAINVTLSIEMIAASVADHLDSNLTVSTGVWYPGTEIDRDNLDDWIDFRVTNYRRKPTRKTGKDVIDITIQLRIVAKITTDLYRHLTSQKDLDKNVFTHAEIPVTNYDTAALVGHAWLEEPHTSNASRGFNHPLPHNSRNLGMTYAGHAQEL